MDTPEVAVARYAAQISLWALYVAGGALFVSACVFGLELRRWFDEGVRLSISIMVDVKIVGVGHQDDNTYVSVTVTNRGSAPTTVTHIYLYNYPNRLAQRVPNRASLRLKSLRPETFFVIAIGHPGPLPYVLEPGRTWTGTAIQTPNVDRMIDGGRLYVGIC